MTDKPDFKKAGLDGLPQAVKDKISEAVDGWKNDSFARDAACALVLTGHDKKLDEYAALTKCSKLFR